MSPATAITYVVVFHEQARPALRIAADEIARVDAVVRATPGVTRALRYLPSQAHDPYLNDGAPPQLALQLYFDDIAPLEAALAPAGALQALGRPDALPTLAGAQVTQQAMLARFYPVPEPRRAPPEPDGLIGCTYLVAYPGAAEDLNAWLAHYIAHHPQLEAKFPAVREIEIGTRIDYTSFMPWPRTHAMLRNKVMFDSPAALTASLNSPVRHEMREDFKRFPPFSGGNTHYPMLTYRIV
jgi:hypothetical protein